MLHALFLAFLQFMASNGGQPITSNQSTGNQSAFSVRVEQKKKDVQVTNHEVRLKKKFFDLVFEFTEPGAVAVLCSLDSTIFKQAESGLPAAQISGFENLGGGGGMAENKFNADQSIMVSKNGYNYWHYESRQDNRFTRTERTSSTITCWRTVGKIELLDTQETFEVVDADRPVYLVFARTDGSQVEYLKINWK